MAAEMPRTAALGQVELVTAAPVAQGSRPSVETVWRTLEARRVQLPEVPALAERRQAAVYVPEGHSTVVAVVPLAPASLAVGCT
ncbi:MAG TPA: hypothetical protein VNY82_16580 [Steroidobacteraceae bacterium]|nr:hypothetical protein [Steroidobacteraceae bacterium]